MLYILHAGNTQYTIGKRVTGTARIVVTLDICAYYIGPVAPCPPHPRAASSNGFIERVPALLCRRHRTLTEGRFLGSMARFPFTSQRHAATNTYTVQSESSEWQIMG